MLLGCQKGMTRSLIILCSDELQLNFTLFEILCLTIAEKYQRILFKSAGFDCDTRISSFNNKNVKMTSKYNKFWNASTL